MDVSLKSRPVIDSSRHIFTHYSWQQLILSISKMMLFPLLLSSLSLARAFPADYENAAASVYTRDNPIAPATQSEVTGQLNALLTCERYGAVSFGKAVLYNDLWNQPIGTGTQCTGRGVLPGSWFTKWTWAQASSSSQVISYANVELAVGRQPISGLASMRSVWHATYRGVKLSANVAFDIFVAPPWGGEQIEIMAWVKQYGSASPISSTGSPIAEVNLPSGRWALWKGRNNYSRMVQSNQTCTDNWLLTV